MSDDIWYRYEDRLVHSGFYYDDGYTAEYGLGTARVEVVLRTFFVVKRTPKGVWLDVFKRNEDDAHNIDGARFVLLKSHKRYACATIEEARESFIARKRKQIVIHMGVLDRAKQALAAMATMEPQT